MTLDENGIALEPTVPGISIDMGGHRIEHLGSGVESGDAVNLGQLLGAVAAETSRAEAAEGVNASAIADETSRATAAEAGLASDLASEAATARAAEGVNATAIADETSRATAAEAGLASDLASEAATARAAETANATAIATETARASAAEGTNASAIADEASRATGAEVGLASDLASEAATARAAEGTNASAIADETSRATGAEAGLSSELASEAATARAAEAANASDIAGVMSTMSIDPTETTIRATGGKSSNARVRVTPDEATMSATTSAGENIVTVDQTGARVAFRDHSGNESGLVVTPEVTTLSGGSAQSTTMRLDADGVTFERADVNKTGRSSGSAPSGGPVVIHGVAAGRAGTDAVNKRQLENLEDEAFRGIAISNALEVFMPEPGRHFRLNMGVGYYKHESALGLTGAGRLTEHLSLYLGAASDSSFEEVGGKAGISFQW